MIHVTHAPADAEPRTWSIDYEAVTIGDVMDLERFSGRALPEIEDAIEEGNRSALMVLWLVWRRRDEPDFTLEDLRKIDWHDITFKGDRPAAAEAAEGKVLGAETEDPAPATA